MPVSVRPGACTPVSYDLHLFRPRPGADVLDCARASYENPPDEPNPGPASPERERWKQSLATALIAHDARLEILPFDFQQFADDQGITYDQAREQWRHLVLASLHDGSGVQITLFDDAAELTLPYRHSGAAANAAWAEVWGLLEILESLGGLRAYDPQFEHVLELTSDMPRVLAEYAKGVAVLQGPQKERAPWWKFW